MAKFYIKLIMVTVLLIIYSLDAINHRPVFGSQEPLTCAMEATGSKVEEFSVHAWGRLPSNQGAPEVVVEQVMEKLGIEKQEYQVSFIHTHQYDIVQAEVKAPNSHVVVIVRSMLDGMGKMDEGTYLVINFEGKKAENPSVFQTQEKIKRIIKDFAILPQIATCLIGWLDGKLMDGEEHKLLCRSFMAVDGQIIDAFQAEQFVSYTGFTSAIEDGLQVANKKINLNMAMRYSQYDNRTYITIGSPIITREY